MPDGSQMKLVLVSDLHVRDPDGSASAMDQVVRIGACLDRVAENCPTATCCVITGDLADAGETAAYNWLKKKLDSLPFPVIPMLGNHDDRDAFRSVFGESGSSGGFIQSTVQFGSFRLVFLDTLAPGEDSGFLCRTRLDWLDQQLSESEDVCLFMHHPPCDIGDPVLDLIKLSNPDDILSLLRKHRNVRQIFFGHVHPKMFLTWKKIPCTSLGSIGVPSPTNGPVFGLLSPDREGLAVTVWPLV